MAVWHRRAGKDETCLHWAAVACHLRPATYWHMLPEASQARKAIWEAINPHTGKRRIDEAFPPEIRETTREQEMFIKFKNGSTWQVVGSDNFNSLVGSPPAGIVFSEWSIANASAWGYMRPILAENGGWALFIYTPRGKNHGYSTFKMAEKEEDWFCQRLTVEDTKALPQKMLDSELQEYIKEYGEEQGTAFYNQEYMCSFDAATLGAVYGAQMTRLEKEGRFRPFAPDFNVPVHTSWDLGRSDSTVIIWWQVVGKEVRILKVWDATLSDVKDLAEAVWGREIKITKRDNVTGRVLKWELGKVLDKETVKFSYGTHYVPHDAANKLLAAGGHSIVQQLHDLGVKTRVVAATSDENSHAAMRECLDRVWIRAELEEFVEHMKQYHYAWDNDKKVLSKKPVHDKHSHFADAAEIIGQVWKMPVQSEIEKKPRFLADLTAKELFWPQFEKKPQEPRF